MTAAYDFTQPRRFLWEIGSFADELRQGYIDDMPFKPGMSDPSHPIVSNWKMWTDYDRLGQMPPEVAPERFYLWSPLRSRKGVGDFSGTADRVVKVATTRFVEALAEAGQEEYQIFPLTFWRRSEGEMAPPPDPDEPLRAVHCWAKTDVFDLERSDIGRLIPEYDPELIYNKYDDASPEPPIYSTSWLKLILRDDRSVELPPLYGIRGLMKRLFVSPQFAETLQRKKMKVNLTKRYLDIEYGPALLEAERLGIVKDWPEEVPLGA